MKKAILFVLLLLIAVVPTFSQRIQKVGLVLSGGGARGLAHVGAIKALEENNIPIDYISGSSVGAIVGALYASGYSVKDIEELFLSEEFQVWLSGKMDQTYSFLYKKKSDNPALLSFSFDTKDKFRFNLPYSWVNPIQMDYAFMELFAEASAVANNNFDSLFVPFLCITSDITSNKASIRRNGDLGQAVRASMTFPLYFSPISIDGKVMFDGGMYNNFPSKEMHDIFNPDIIVGVKISGNYPQPKEGDIVSYLQNIFTRDTDYDVICHNGVMIEPDLKEFGILEFSRMKDTYDIGYRAALEKISMIRDFLIDSVSELEIDSLRKEFNSKKPPLEIKNLVINGVNDIQKSYIEKTLMYKNSKDYSTKKLKANYLSLCLDNNIKSIQPSMYYNDFFDSYVLNLNVQTKRYLTTKIGGCFSSNPISHLYIGADFNVLRKSSWLFQTNVYLGRYYTSFMANARFDYPTSIPFFSELEFNTNMWSYYSLKTKFFDFSPLNYIVQRETNVQLRFGIPLWIKDKLVANIGLGVVGDDYFNTQNASITDTADYTKFTHLAAGITRTFSTLNNNQYPTSGSFSKMQMQYINGRERFFPGNTSSIDDFKKKNHSWIQFTLRHKQFFNLSKFFSIGWNADVFYSFQNLFSNYTSSILNAGVYAPTLETFTQYMPEYRTNQYLATGVENIFKFKFYRVNSSIRLSGFLFAPISQIITLENDIPSYSSDFFKKVYYIFSSALVFETPIGPLSVLGGYHLRDDKTKNPFSISINFGYVMFNNKNIDR